jgi:hypothetical protein
MIKTGQNVDVDDFLIVTTAGEALSARDAVYISASDGKAYKCDADDPAKLDFAGFAQEAAALNASVNVVPPGNVMTGFSSLTTGSSYYLSSTAGAITATKPASYVRLVAVAISTTAVRIIEQTYNTELLGTPHAMGPLSNGLVKLFHTMHLPFLLNTASGPSDDTGNEQTHWERTGNQTQAVIGAGGQVVSFESTGDASIAIRPVDEIDLDYADNNIIIADWWAKYVSGTGRMHMGLFESNVLTVDTTTENGSGVGYSINNGLLYAVTKKADPNKASTYTQITGITLTNWNNYRVEFDMGADTVRFYINGVLKQTSVGAGGAGDSIPISGGFHVGFGRDTTNPVLFQATAPFLSIEMNP